MKKTNILILLLITGLIMAYANPTLAAVTAEEAKQLGTTLTKFGAEKAGNEDGSIPPYTGGIDNVPGYDPKTSRVYVDPFADEDKLYSVSAKNMQEYADMLTEGTKELMRLHPEYRIDVYPTHRTVRYPDWVLENTIKNATTATLAGKVEGDAVEGADKGNFPYPGVPFPIPKNGYEVMWNYRFSFGPAINRIVATGYLVDSGGNMSSLPTCNTYHFKPWYDLSGKMRGMTEDASRGFCTRLDDPPSSAGTVFLNFYLPRGDNGGQNVWFYTPGQRRVRRAPEFAYDVPIASYAGVLLWDETFGFVGRLDRFDFKLLGKKEMLVPYNVFGETNTMTHEEFVGPKFINPEAIRYEKHRIWVVEATRKSTARHVYSKRLFYIDEDSWALVGSEGYDNTGTIWRVIQDITFPTYDTGGFYWSTWNTYDLLKGNYTVINVFGDPQCYVKNYDSMEGQRPPLTPNAVAARGIR